MIEDRRARGCKNIWNAYLRVIITVHRSSFVTLVVRKALRQDSSLMHFFPEYFEDYSTFHFYVCAST